MARGTRTRPSATSIPHPAATHPRRSRLFCWLLTSNCVTSSIGAAGTSRERSTSRSSANCSADERPAAGSLITGRRNVHYFLDARNTPSENAHPVAAYRSLRLAPKPAEGAGLSTAPGLSHWTACAHQLRRRRDRKERGAGRSRRNWFPRRRTGRDDPDRPAFERGDVQLLVMQRDRDRRRREDPRAGVRWRPATS